jgi:hypothetical protein
MPCFWVMRVGFTPPYDYGKGVSRDESLSTLAIKTLAFSIPSM